MPSKALRVATFMLANTPDHWRGDSEVRYETGAQPPRPLNVPGCAFSQLSKLGWLRDLSAIYACAIHQKNIEEIFAG